MSRLSASFAFALVVLAARPAVAGQAGGPKVGDPAPEMNIERLLQAPSGQKTDLASLRGNVVVLEFWATWCAPCIAAMPHMNELAKKYEGKPVRFVSVSDESAEKVQGFLKRGLLKSWVGIDADASLLKAYGVRSIPRTIVIDKQGRIAAMTYPTQVDEKMLDRVLADLPAVAAPVAPPDAAPTGPAAPKPAAPLYQMEIRPTTDVNGFVMTNPGEGVIQMGAQSLGGILQTVLQTTSKRLVLEGALPTDKFNVNAQVPKAVADTLFPTLRQMVETTFSLEIRKETRRLPVIVLTAPSGSGPELKVSQDKGFHASSSPGIFAVQSAPLRSMHGYLENQFDRIVVDETNLTGKYDYLLKFTQGDLASLRNALRELGIHTKEETREMEVHVVRPRPAG